MTTELQTAPQSSGLHPPKNSSDTAESTPSGTDSMRCPDPSAHRTKDTSLQDHASAAAMNSNSLPRETRRRDTLNPLGPDGKLSSASAAASLKHAHATELPSFPVVGIDTHASAGTAATLANANKKSPEWWKPEHSTVAGKAALLANGYKMEPLWQPEASSAGSKAALLAHKGGANLNLWTPESSAAGHSAATLAMAKQKPPAEVQYGHTDDFRQRALAAATGAVSSGRRRAQSTPPAPAPYPDSANSAKNALNAATIAHRPSVKARTAAPSSPLSPTSDRFRSDAMEAARIQHSKVSREMYTSTPPVSLEVDEKKRQDALRASAISMAKKMYDVQQQSQQTSASSRSQAQRGATVAQGTYGREEGADLKEEAMRYIGVQEAAQKLAAERLAKIGFDENAAYRSYYGYEQPTRNRLSLRLGRNRASSEPQPPDSDDDEFQSRRIRTQMSQFNKQLAEVDAKKREQDRRYLLAAAQRKVQTQMEGLDKKIFDETGHMSPAMVEEWDARARAKAAAASEIRMENHGKVHIGHGKYMDQADIDAVALARVQPTLDEITEKTERRRAEEEERRLDLEERRREERIEKERAAEIKAEERRFKQEEKKAAKAHSAEEKAAARQEKEAEKEKQTEEKRFRKKVRETKMEPPVTAEPPTDSHASAPITAPDDAGDRADAAEQPDTDSLYREPTPADQPAPTDEHSRPASPTSPTSPSSPKRIKAFLNKFKRRSKHSAASAEAEKPGFIGGAALRRSSTHSNRDSTFSPRPDPMHRAEPERRYSDVSSISTDLDAGNSRGRGPELNATKTVSVSSDGAEFEETRDSFDEKLAPPPAFVSSNADAARKGSPSRDSKFREVGL